MDATDMEAIELIKSAVSTMREYVEYFVYYRERCPFFEELTTHCEHEDCRPMFCDWKDCPLSDYRMSPEFLSQLMSKES